MNDFRILGLKKTASIQDIKRAYAGKLKKYRPDEDAVGFQKINAAYQAAILIANERDARLQHKTEAEQRKLAALTTEQENDLEDEDEDEDNYNLEYHHDEVIDKQATDTAKPIHEPVSLIKPPVLNSDIDTAQIPNTEADIGPVLTETPETRPRAPAKERPSIFLLDDFIEQLRLLSAVNDDSALRNWLDKHPALYSINLKHQITEPLLESLLNDDEPIRPPALEILIKFLGLDFVSVNQHWTNHLVNATRLQSENYWRNASLVWAFKNKSKSKTFTDRMLFNELEGPVNYFRSAFILIFPGLIPRIRDLALQFVPSEDTSGKQYTDPVITKYWLSLSDPRKVSLPRIFGAIIFSIIVAAFIQLFSTDIHNSGLKFALVIFTVWLAQALIRVAYVRLQAYLPSRLRTTRNQIISIIFIVIGVTLSRILLESLR